MKAKPVRETIHPRVIGSIVHPVNSTVSQVVGQDVYLAMNFELNSLMISEVNSATLASTAQSQPKYIRAAVDKIFRRLQ